MSDQPDLIRHRADPPIVVMGKSQAHRPGAALADRRAYGTPDATSAGRLSRARQPERDLATPGPVIDRRTSIGVPFRVLVALWTLAGQGATEVRFAGDRASGVHRGTL
jgi:hypothetical protein